LADTEATGHEERQGFDIPEMRMVVTAQRAEVKICPHCGGKTTGAFPAGVTQAVQDGPTVKTWAAYFPHQHHIPVERTAQIFAALVHQPVSEATVLQASEDLAQCLDPSTEAVQAMLRNSEVLHVDASGLRVQSKLHWLHVASTDPLTHYAVHTKRGHEGMEAAGILGTFTGTAMYDHWAPYFTYAECRHALCNAHHLRELQFIAQQFAQAWANDMAELLLEIKTAVEDTRAQAASVPPEWLEACDRRYEAIVQEGFEATPLPPPPAPAGTAKKGGRPKQTPPRNLLIRLRDFKAQGLAFMYDFHVPFDNKQAERDVRMVKVKQKVSGCFRTLEGAERFGRIRGYISTARKNAKNVFEAIREAFVGAPSSLFQHCSQGCFSQLDNMIG
jgi:transposase